MKEQEWVQSVVCRIGTKIKQLDPSLRIADGQRLPYACEGDV